VKYTYANGVEHVCRSTTASAWNGDVKDPDGQQHGIKFIGSDGWIWVTRGYINASDRQLLRDRLPASAPRVYASNDHMQNFVDCVRSRQAPICPAEVGHRSASLCHLGVIAIRLGRKLHWDPVRERFEDDAEADARRPRHRHGERDEAREQDRADVDPRRRRRCERVEPPEVRDVEATEAVAPRVRGVIDPTVEREEDEEEPLEQPGSHRVDAREEVTLEEGHRRLPVVLEIASGSVSSPLSQTRR